MNSLFSSSSGAWRRWFSAGLALLFSASVSAQQYCQDGGSALESGRFQVEAEGWVVDNATGLRWQRCIVGLEYKENIERCLGMPRRYTFEEASQYAEFAGARDGVQWRVPSRDELLSLVLSTCKHPALDTRAFPNTPISSFWSNSLSPNVEEFAWSVYFGNGESDYMLISDRLYLRLVSGDLTSLGVIESAEATF